MPRCLMAKKWKAYPWPERPDPPEDEEEEIDVVGDSSGSCWGPSSPTAGATAPSPPPTSPHGTTLLYNGYLQELSPTNYTTTFIQRNDPQSSPVQSHQPSYATLRTVTESQDLRAEYNISPSVLPQRGRKSLAMCFTSTGAALSLPPKKKDIYRPYSLDDRPSQPPPPRVPAEEDLHAAHAILDLSASTTVFLPPPPPSQPIQIIEHNSQLVDLRDAQREATGVAVVTAASVGAPTGVVVAVTSAGVAQHAHPHQQQQQQHQQHQQPQLQQQQPREVCMSPQPLKNADAGGDYQQAAKTVAYTYEAFFVSDGRSKKRLSGEDPVGVSPKVASLGDKQKYTCCECGKQYATSSNLSRHKQTHRSLDSQAAKKCITCGKAYVSMPALAMHVLTHKLLHKCGVCGKQFSRPWLLQGHLRSHTGEKPYGCAHCGKAFADRSNLRAHMQTHSSDKNFECPRCHKSFALKSYLNKHLESACLKDENGSGGGGGGVSPDDDSSRVAIEPVAPLPMRVHAG